MLPKQHLFLNFGCSCERGDFQNVQIAQSGVQHLCVLFEKYLIHIGSVVHVSLGPVYGVYVWLNATLRVLYWGFVGGCGMDVVG